MNVIELESTASFPGEAAVFEEVGDYITQIRLNRPSIVPYR